MNAWSSRPQRGMTLAEVLVVMALVSVLGLLLAQAFGQTNLFYRQVSAQSREVGAATLVLDRLQGLCFGLPRQAIQIEDSEAGSLLIVQPVETVGAAGTAIYSDSRIVIESSEKGVRWWDVSAQGRGLGKPLETFPPTEVARFRILLAEGWSLGGSFPDNRFPLRLELRPPAGDRVYIRTVAGYL